MALSTSSPAHTIAQLESARTLALGDAAYYPKIVPGVLPFFGPTASLDLRRWGADFLAETFASPTLASEEKQSLSLEILQTLLELLEIPGGDTGVVKSAVQIATSVYPLVFKHTIYNPNDGPSWQKMAAIKSNILRRMDTAPAGVRICCIKFIQRVVQVQTPGLIADPRRPEQNELSLSLVPRDHPLIPPPTLEAEAIGLLDRALSVFQESECDALLVTATLNSVGVLVRTRASIASKILNAILNFNPFKIVNGPLTPRIKVMIKAMERTTKAFLINLNKRNPNHPLAARVQAYLERLQQTRTEVFDENSRKRPAPVEATNGLDQAKRQRLGEDVSSVPPQGTPRSILPPGPISIAQLFTLTQDPGPQVFDVHAIPFELVNKILVPILSSIDQTNLDNAVNAVRTRYLSLSQPQHTSKMGALKPVTGSGIAEDDLRITGNAESSLKRVGNGPSQGFAANRPSEVALGPYVIPQPPPLTGDEVDEYGSLTVTRVLGMVNSLGDPATVKNSKLGFNRLAASDYDRDSWVTVVTRLATRGTGGLEETSTTIKQERGTVGVRRNTFSMSDAIREALYRYVLDDFRRRIDVAISWLNEEWYNDQVQARTGSLRLQLYDRLALQVLDAMVPYLDAKDKVLIRFLSEIPAINQDILERVKKLAKDPERVSLACNALHYLALFRPPVREICIDALEDLWRNYDDAKTVSAKLLTRWRPQILDIREVIDSKPPQPPSAATVL